MSDTKRNLKLVSGILLRCLIVAVAALIICLVFLALGEYWFPIHARLFDLSESEIKRLHFEGVMLFRTLAICLFLCPLLAIELVVRSKKML